MKVEVDKTKHMVSIPLEQYNTMISKLEDEDYLSQKFQDVIEQLGQNAHKIPKETWDIISKVLKYNGIEIYLDNQVAGLQVRMIKKEE